MQSKIPSNTLDKNKCNCNCLSKISNVFIGGLEYGFYWYGVNIARRPFLFIFISLLIAGLCSIGLINFGEENDPFKLWIPQDAEFLKVTEWQKLNFPSDKRFHSAIYEADNVLDKKVILEILRVHEEVDKIKVDDVSWSSVCAKIPVIAIALFGRKKRDISLKSSVISEVNSEREKRQAPDLDWSRILSRDVYCNFLENMDEECLTNSLLEIWGYDRSLIESLTNEQIIDDINEADISEVFGFPVNFTSYLGMVQRNSESRIIGAKATRQTWLTTINKAAIKDGDSITDEGTGSQIDKGSLEWERRFIDTVLNTTNREEDVNIYFLAASSFGLVAGNSIQNDLRYLSIGFIVVFIFVVLMLGKFNMIEMRPVLSLLGLSSVGLSIGVSYGLCSAFGFPYGPVNSILPFLLLGLGVDDMFVIIQAWNNLSPLEINEELPERMGLALRHAGVSITVTSLTDFVAFAIGSSTLLPALRSFCIYAALGIIAIYFFSATFFVACLTLDQRRLEDKRNGLFWCWRMNNWTPNECSQKDLLQSFFGNVYAKILLKLPTKITVLIITATLVGVSGWGLSNLRQEFDPSWFLPQSSYPFKFFAKSDEYFPSSGVSGKILLGNLNYTKDIAKILQLEANLKENPYIGSVDSWVSEFQLYMNNSDITIPDPDMSEDDFYENLTKFLFSQSGAKYRGRDFKFDGELKCLNKSPPIFVSTISYQHVQMDDSRTEINAMDQLSENIAEMKFSGYARAWSRQYGNWETNKVIAIELLRNLGYALLVVFILTLILISSLSTSLLVLLCVVMTLIDVGALMHWWGLTIDTVSCIDLVLAIGLCVDYAAHIGHSFMTKRGTRNERARLTLEMMGPAVLQGGFSTVLAFFFLAFSDSHVFITFFKIFFSVSLFGLYHGLVFLPVVLSLIGPAPYQSANQDDSKSLVISPKISPKNISKEPQVERELNGDGFITKDITPINTPDLEPSAPT
ncbi:unnamed protein product, partial [Meganyctiphanes norvegica]